MVFSVGKRHAAANQAPDADPVVVVLDPGHGGHDQGARYKWDGKTYKEKQLNLAIAKACKTELEKYAGVKVYMTRSSDRFVTLGNRVNFAKKQESRSVCCNTQQCFPEKNRPWSLCLLSEQRV